ncbi:MAG TPA: hypothetical protein VKE24_15265 [Candidatus Acidoferrales bacterium]|nr:hypothetical protein [Candidatus Acidoferrales bacterium]
MAGEQPERKSEARRSQRIVLSLPVVVQADSADQQPLRELTDTLVVNAHGALIALTMRVAIGHRLLLENQQTQETQPSKVVYLGPVREGKTLVHEAHQHRRFRDQRGFECWWGECARMEQK